MNFWIKRKNPSMPDFEIMVCLRDIDIYHIQKNVAERPGRYNWAIIKKIDADLRWIFDKNNERTDFSKKEKIIRLHQRQYSHIQHVLAQKGGKYNWSIINKINEQTIKKYYPANGFYHDSYSEIMYCNNCECKRTFSNQNCDHCGKKNMSN